MGKKGYGPSHLVKMDKPRTSKARKRTWCRKCRAYVYPGEWMRSTIGWAEHRYRCPDPIEAARSYAERQP